jgi:hypothetical protein
MCRSINGATKPRVHTLFSIMLVNTLTMPRTRFGITTALRAESAPLLVPLVQATWFAATMDCVEAMSGPEQRRR